MHKLLPLAFALILFGGCSKFDLPTEPKVENPAPKTSSLLVLVEVDSLPAPGVAVLAIGLKSVSGVTDSIGQVVFSDLPVGAYAVSISGFFSGILFKSTSAVIDVVESEDVSVVFSGTSPLLPPEVLRATITGRVWVDDNKNGTYEAGETVFIGLTVALSGQELRSVITDAAGRYTFSNLGSGSYDVIIVNPDPTTFVFSGGTSANVAIDNPSGNVFVVDFRATQN